MAKRSKKSLEVAVNEAVRLQTEVPSAKQDRLLNLLSANTSSAPGGGSTSGPPQLKVNNQGDEALVSRVMRDFGMTREEAIRELKLYGGL